MGCSASQSKTSVPISNSIMHLLQSGQTDQVIKRLDQDKSIDKNASYNFRGDTLLHYSCSKNNYKLVEYLLKNGADKSVKNIEGQTPADLASDSSIIDLCGGQKPKQNTNNSVPAQKQPQPMTNKQQIQEKQPQVSKPLQIPQNNPEKQKNHQDFQKMNEIKNSLSYKKLKYNNSSEQKRNTNLNTQDNSHHYNDQQKKYFESPKKQVAKSEHPPNIFDVIKRSNGNDGGKQQLPREKIHSSSYNQRL